LFCLLAPQKPATASAEGVHTKNFHEIMNYFLPQPHTTIFPRGNKQYEQCHGVCDLYRRKSLAQRSLFRVCDLNGVLE
jgi:hypothetical protein